MKKVILLILVFALGAALFPGCGGSDSASPSTNPSQKAQLKAVKGTVGETVTLSGDTAITVKRVLKNPADDKIILVEVEIKNVSNTLKIYSYQNFLLKDNSGNTYASTIVKVPNPVLLCHITNLLPGKTLSGFLGFDIPQGVTVATLVYIGATGNIEIEISLAGE